MLERPRFAKNIEHFTCAVCGKKVQGNGYTDHCDNCCASVHKDRNPGDRASNCQRVMEPIGLEYQNRKTYILYKCTGCGYTHRNQIAKNDNPATLRLIASHQWRRDLF